MWPIWKVNPGFGEVSAEVFWMRYDLDRDGRSGEEERYFSRPRILSLPGGPDGMKVDRKGNLFVTGPGGILVIAPEGEHLGTIGLPLPAIQPGLWTQGEGTLCYRKINIVRINLK